jgi:hypothetical protein
MAAMERIRTCSFGFGGAGPGDDSDASRDDFRVGAFLRLSLLPCDFVLSRLLWLAIVLIAGSSAEGLLCECGLLPVFW